MDNHRVDSFVEIDTNMNTAAVEKKCLLCFSKIFGNYSRVTSIEFKKLFSRCSSHVPLAITTETLLLNILVTREKYVTICRHCWDILTELSHVAGQITKFEKEMNNLSLAFSMGVLYRRSSTDDENNGQSANKQKIELDISSLPAKWFRKSTSRNVDNEPNPSLPTKRFRKSTSRNVEELTPVDQPIEQQSGDDQININVVNTGAGNDFAEIDIDPTLPPDIADFAIEDLFSDGSLDLDKLKATFSNAEFNLLNIVDEHDQLENNAAAYYEVPDGNQIPPAGNHIPPDGNQMPPAGNQIPLDGNQIPPAGNQIPPAGNQIPPAGNQIPPDGNQMPPDGNQIPPDGNQIPARNSSEDSSVTNESAGSVPMSALINTVSMPRIILERVKCKEKKNKKNYSGLKKSRGNKSEIVKRRNIQGSSCHRGNSKDGKKCKRMNSLVCQYCKRILSSTTGLKVHLRTHTGERPYKCSICMREYKTIGNLKRHEKIYDSHHQEYKSHKCPFCEIIFATSSALKFHLQFHPGAGHVKPYKCKTCKRMFTNVNTLHKHLKIHVPKSIYECSVCKKGFERLNSFLLHKLVHTPKKPHKCAFCKRTFTFKSRMKSHEAIHTKKKPFKCSVCRKQFTRISALVKHERLHLQGKSFKCSVCGKAFNDSEKFKNHISYHTRKTRPTCSSCPKTVGRPSKLTLSKLKKCKSCLAFK